MSLMGLLGHQTQIGKESMRYELVQEKYFKQTPGEKEKEKKYKAEHSRTLRLFPKL